jgi:hypothetical protein
VTSTPTLEPEVKAKEFSETINLEEIEKNI